MTNPVFTFIEAALIGLFGFNVALISCGQASTPKTGPGTSWPCGYQGVECPDNMCCPRFHVCGHTTAYGSFNRCEPGYCCADADYNSGTLDYRTKATPRAD